MGQTWVPGTTPQKNLKVRGIWVMNMSEHVSMGISPENMAKNMVLTYLHFRILKFPLIVY